MTLARAGYERFGQLIYESAKFGVIGVAGLVVTNAVYGLLFIHLGAGPVTSATTATVVAAVATYLGNRYWSFRTRQRTGVVHEVIVFAVLNGIGLLIQDATVAVNYYLLQLGHSRLAGLIALNFGIALATMFRFWSYRRFVWAAPSASAVMTPLKASALPSGSASGQDGTASSPPADSEPGVGRRGRTPSGGRGRGAGGDVRTRADGIST